MVKAWARKGVYCTGCVYLVWKELIWFSKFAKLFNLIGVQSAHGRCAPCHVLKQGTYCSSFVMLGIAHRRSSLCMALLAVWLETIVKNFI